MKALSAIIPALLLLALPVSADVVKTVETEYYTVQGRTPKEIYNYLKKHSPLNKGTETYQAHTRTSIRYKYEWTRKGNTCAVTDAIIYLHLTYVYPKLARSVDYKTRTWWKDLLGKLEVHELIHGDISIKAAHALDDELNRIHNIRCSDFKKVVKRKIAVITEKMEQDQIDYDKLTEHGLKQERNMGKYP